VRQCRQEKRLVRHKFSALLKKLWIDFSKKLPSQLLPRRLLIAFKKTLSLLHSNLANWKKFFLNWLHYPQAKKLSYFRPTPKRKHLKHSRL
jgi:hypothetical protein